MQQQSKSVMKKVEKLGLTPSVEAVHDWFLDAGFTKHIVGKSFQGRDLCIFLRRLEGPNSEENHETKTVLFQSLIHGNEPLGLISLLHTAEALLTPRNINRQMTLMNGTILDIIFFPFVNIDAYILNLKLADSHDGIGGCRRTNLRHTCMKMSANFTIHCDSGIINDGIDLNRNFQADWFGGPFRNKCSYNHAGDAPFSEPESRSVKYVVDKYQPSAAISYHSRLESTQALLIHPVCSDILHDMDEQSQNRFKNWGDAMNRRRGTYIVENAMEAIGYSARGATIDWMFFHGNVNSPFVHESATPCGGRWCPESYRHQINDNAILYSHAGVTLVDLVLKEGSSSANDVSHWYSAFAAFMIVIAVFLPALGKIQKASKFTKYLCIRVGTKFRLMLKSAKHPEMEMRSLV